MPYIYRNAVFTSKTGIPVMRSMVMEFMGDKNCEYLDKQYMFGDSLMVAPVFNDKSIAEYYLPEGDWTDFLSGEKRAGGKWYKENCPYSNVPLFARENSIITVGSCDDRPDYDYADGVELRIYELKDEASTVVYNQKAETDLTVKAIKDKDRIMINLTAAKPLSIRLVNLLAANVSGAEMKQEGTDTLLIPDSGSECITINLH